MDEKIKRGAEGTELGVLLVDVREASSMLSIGVSTIWRLVKKGEFPQPVKIAPRVVRWKRSALIDWAQNL